MGHSRVVETFQEGNVCKFSYEGEESGIGVVLRSENVVQNGRREENRRGTMVPEAHFEKRTPPLGFMLSSGAELSVKDALAIFLSIQKVL